MDATESMRRDGGGCRPARGRRRTPVVPIASILMLSCAWIATPRHAAAEEGTRAKLASQASAVGGQIRDATLASRVRAALVAERGLASADIDVQVHDRVVELTGNVPDERQRATAIRVAHDVDGVSGVRDKLQIRRK
ncbi:BON domain-containing protein [Burkholderia cenocepacia]|uniref:BON domain-containing protein n=1 Tax=Burkholderia cenocepacia TaxID=95486 RepID=UPI001905B7CE|nr:BON domain-containing protein [Burkholderia cenocepacia]MBJ9895514.1 BON domain-containing protein [Burkholderia cenocepacia]MBJ9915151.1 BON domain-containing protein [Burkholderia cenocepacia]MBR8114542.1 BON domain-containing protein [Burkholderia cenocepacia]MBR8367770.1 BON domain-containing protein [Burkholderia cenocepacia]MBR8381071.1 BON domain-containing protein [Burkholderia cenocepacia]